MIAHIQGQTGREQTVLEHLENTARLAGQIGESLNMGNLAYLTALLHDLGKWRDRFDKYLRDAAAGRPSARRGSVNHSSAGAIYIYERYYEKPEKTSDLGTELKKKRRNETAQLIANAIFSHHGLMDCVSPEGEPVFIKRLESREELDYGEVLSNIKNSDITEKRVDELFQQAVSETACYMEHIENYAAQLFPGPDKENKGKAEKTVRYFMAALQRQLLSVLIDADRLDTAAFCGDRAIGGYLFGTGDAGTEEERAAALWQLLSENLEKYIGRFHGSGKIDGLRTGISEECLHFAARESGIYRLSVPTGGAKTLSSLRYALNHARLHGKKRVFYIAPYLSILEQNADVFRRALQREDVILEHHSNIIMENEGEEGEHENQDRYRHLTENWDAPVIVTTFVQFLNTMFSDSTQSVRRFHNLADSVILIDEIQSLPMKMIDNFNMFMNFLHRMCRVTAVLCSATQPILDCVEYPLDMAPDREMIPDYPNLYKELKRVEVVEKKEELDSAGLRKFAVTLMEKEEDAADDGMFGLLIILNTKKAVRTVYEELKNYYRERETAPPLLIHLSTGMCAAHRLQKLEMLKERLGREKVICVSTNLIEAGVDLSFACVIRSFAGLDSVVQAAGRCNRNGEMKGMGIVYLVHVKEENLGRLEQIRAGGLCTGDMAADYKKNKAAYDYDLLSPVSMEIFYHNFYAGEDIKKQMRYPIKEADTNLLELLSTNGRGMRAYFDKFGDRPLYLPFFQAFKSAGKYFQVIEQATVGVLVPYGEGETLIKELNGLPEAGDIQGLLRKAQRYTVNMYRYQLEQLSKTGALTALLDGGMIALKGGFYDEDLGVNNEGHMDFLETG